MPALKLCFSRQTRRMSLPESSLTFDILKCKAKFLFRAILDTDDFEFLWLDEDGDTIVVSSNEELVEAIRIMESDNRPSLRFEIRTQEANTAFSFLPPTFSTVAQQSTGVDKENLSAQNNVKHCGFEQKREDISPLNGIPYFNPIRLGSFEKGASMEKQPFPILKFYTPEKSHAMSLPSERRCRTDRRSLKGPYYRSHSHSRSLSSNISKSLEKPQNRLPFPTPSRFSYFQRLHSGPKSLPPMINKNDSKSPVIVTNFPFFTESFSLDTATPLTFVPSLTVSPASECSTDGLSVDITKKVADEAPLFQQPPVLSPAPKEISSLTSFPFPLIHLPKPMARFIQDVTFPDGASLLPRSVFLKTWRVRNDGTHKWPECVLVCAGGEPLAASDTSIAVPPLCPGQGKNVVYECFLEVLLNAFYFC
jgi:Ig-like domain from next to BRCA1 gene/PB1 domain